MFGRIAFGNEMGSAATALNRWEGPLRYQITGPATPIQRDVIDRRMAALAGLTGLDIQAGSPANFVIHTGPRPDAEAIRADYPSLRSGALSVLARARCFFLFRAERGPIVRAFAFVPASLDDAAFRHCAAEETAQALGLPSDDGPPGSIFNDRSDVPDLVPIDRLLLRLLYAPELRAGMSEAEALPAARAALRRLLAP